MARKSKRVVDAVVETVSDVVVADVVVTGKADEMAKKNKTVETVETVETVATVAAETVEATEAFETVEFADTDEGGETDETVEATEPSDEESRGRKGGNFGVRTFFLLRDSGLSEDEIRAVVESDDEPACLALVKQAKAYAATLEGKEPGKRGRKVSQEVIAILAANGFTLENLKLHSEKEQRKIMNRARSLASAMKNGFNIA